MFSTYFIVMPIYLIDAAPGGGRYPHRIFQALARALEDIPDHANFLSSSISNDWQSFIKFSNLTNLLFSPLKVSESFFSSVLPLEVALEFNPKLIVVLVGVDMFEGTAVDMWAGDELDTYESVVDLDAVLPFIVSLITREGMGS